MKTLTFRGISRGLAAASLVAAGACADDISNPFQSGDSSSGGSSDGSNPDDGNDDGVMTTTGVDTTAGMDEGTTAADGATTMSLDDGTTASVDDDTTNGGMDSSGTTEASSGSTDDGESSSSDDGTPAMLCPADIITEVPGSINGNTNGEDDEFGSSCGGSGAPDLAYTLQAPMDGFYVFDTAGSSFDTVVYVLEGDCGGAEMLCNDDNLGPTSEVGVALNQDDIVTVVVDSFGISGGAFTLNTTVFEGVCPDSDVGSVIPQTLTGETTTGDNTLVGTCGGSISNDSAFTFTAPQDGIYLFDTIGSDFDTVLHVRDECGGTELGCNNDIDGVETASQVNLTLQQDDSVVLVVDGNDEDGNYTLNIAVDACPDEAALSVVPQTVTGTTATDVNSTSPSCGFSTTAPDYAYSFIAPADGTYIFDTNGSAYDTILSVIDGATCDAGDTLACDDNSGGGNASLLAVPLLENQEVTAVIDGFFTSNGNYTLNIDVLGGECPNDDLGNTVPATASGTTAGGGADDTVVGSCGGLGANDDTYTFTAPADGSYVIDTFGSDYDTLLYVYDGSGCAGMELGCNDDALGATNGTSGLILDLVQDQVITIAVDGSNADGNYTVNVDVLGGVCPDTDLGNTIPQSVMGDTSGGDNTVLGTCGGAFAPDDTYTFTAPADGLYIFDTIGSMMNTALYVLEGNDCTGVEVDCNTNGTDSVVSAGMLQDEQITIVVDGADGSGAYTLNVDVDSCPDDDLGMLVPQTLMGSTVGLSDSASPGCAGSTAGDFAYLFTAPAAGNYTFDTQGSGFDTILHATDGNVCGGVALACNDDTFGLQSQITVNLAANQEIIVYVDGFSANEGNFTLNVN